MTLPNEWREMKKGFLQKMLISNKGLLMMEVKVEKGAERSEHRHPHEQMTYCLKGKLAFYVNGEERIITEGEALYIPGGSTHGVKAIEDSRILISGVNASQLVK